MDSVKVINFRLHEDINGKLCAYESDGQVPFNIKRVFTVTAQNEDIRGNHAHIHCTQLMVCVSGSLVVSCDDGINKQNFNLTNMNVGLLIPPLIWCRQQYGMNGSVLMVMCDRFYNPDDYIYDYNTFKNLTSSSRTK